MRAGMARYLGIAAMGICVAVSAAAATDTDDKVLLNACWGPAELAAKPGENLSRRGDRRFDAPPTDGWLVTPSEQADLRRRRYPPRDAAAWQEACRADVRSMRTARRDRRV